MSLSNIVSFIKNILPVFNRSDVESDIEVSINYIKNVSLESFKNLETIFKVSDIKSNSINKLIDTFYKNLDMKNSKVRLTPNNNIASDLVILLTNVLTNAEYIIKNLDKYMSDTIITNGLSSKKAFFLRSASHLTFISKYASDLANYIYVCEAMEINKDLDDSYKLVKKQVETIEKNIWIFARLLSVYGVNSSVFESNLNKIKEVSITNNTEEEETAINLYQSADIDIIDNIPSGFIGSPIYTIKQSFANWEADRYKEMKEKKKLLELRYLHYTLLSERGDTDIELEKEMEHLKKRIDDYSYKISKIEANNE